MAWYRNRNDEKWTYILNMIVIFKENGYIIRNIAHEYRSSKRSARFQWRGLVNLLDLLICRCGPLLQQYCTVVTHVQIFLALREFPGIVVSILKSNEKKRRNFALSANFCLKKTVKVLEYFILMDKFSSWKTPAINCEIESYRMTLLLVLSKPHTYTI
jgi:hypothetical protein